MMPRTGCGPVRSNRCRLGVKAGRVNDTSALNSIVRGLTSHDNGRRPRPIDLVNEEAFLNYLQIKEGSIVFSKNTEVKKKLEETNEEILDLAVAELRNVYHSGNPEVYTNIPLSLKSDDFENIVPQIGDKKKLVDLSLKNALYLKREKEIEKESGRAVGNVTRELL